MLIFNKFDNILDCTNVFRLIYYKINSKIAQYSKNFQKFFANNHVLMHYSW